MLHLKKPELAPEESDRAVRLSAESMLDDIQQRGEVAVPELAKKFDHWEGDFVLSDESANKTFSAIASRISRIERHARACDWRLRKYFPEQDRDFEVYHQA